MKSPGNVKQSIASDIADFIQMGLHGRMREVIRLEAAPGALLDEQTLRQVSQRLSENFSLVYDDLEPWLDVSLDDFLLNLAGKIAQSVSIPSPSPEDASQSAFLSKFLPRVFEALERERRQLVLVLDHFELAGRSNYQGTVGRTLLPFLYQIRDTVPSIRLIVVTRSKAQELQDRVIDFVKGSISYKIPEVAPPDKEKIQPSKSFLIAIGVVMSIIVAIVLLIGAFSLIFQERKMVCDGGFDRANLACWDHGGEASIVEKEGQRVVLLGNPEFGCRTGVDESRAKSSISQLIRVPATGEYELSFRYRVVTYEVPESQVCPFEVFLNDQVILQTGNSVGPVNCSSSPADSGWLTFRQTFHLLKGDAMLLEFWDRIDAESRLNTWTYIDNVQLVHITGGE